MSSVKIRLSLPSPMLVGHPLIYRLVLEGLGAGGLTWLWVHGITASLHPQIPTSPSPCIPASPHPWALPKPDEGEEKSGEKGLG